MGGLAYEMVQESDDQWFFQLDRQGAMFGLLPTSSWRDGWEDVQWLPIRPVAGRGWWLICCSGA